MRSDCLPFSSTPSTHKLLTMGYRCHTMSSDDTLPAHHSEAKYMPKSKKISTSRRNEAKKPVHVNARAHKQHHRVVHAIKKKRKQRRRDPVHVFVGNLNQTVAEDTLQEHFSQCGKVLSVEIRCSGGLAMTTGRPDPAYIGKYSARQYAMLTFLDASAASNALELNGSRLVVGDSSSELVVSRSPADLPEVIEKVQQRLEEYRARNGFADTKRARQSAMRALNLEPTILLEARADKDPRRKMNIFGFSFPMPLF